MADIFNEIDEELRGDQMRRLWTAYSGPFVVIAVLIVLGVAGWRGWEYWSEQTAKADGDKYLAALQLSSNQDYTGAEAALSGLQTTGNAGYRTLSRLRAADELSLAGDQTGALAAFDAIAKDGSIPTIFNGFASIRAAYLALDLEDRDKLEARVKPINVAGNPWRHAAREILAVSAWKADDIAAAKSWVDQIETDADTPADLTNRVTILSAVISAAKKSDVPTAVATPPVPAPSAVTPTPATPASAAPVSDAPPASAAPAATAPAPEPTPAAPPAPATKPEAPLAPATKPEAPLAPATKPEAPLAPATKVE